MNSQQRNYRPPAGSIGGNLNDHLERLIVGNPTVGQLSEINKLIDRECLLRSRQGANPDSTLSSGSLIEIVLHLSKPLLRWLGADSDIFRETQARALISALALLHHTGVTELSASPHDELRRNIAGRFNDIVNAPRTSLENRIRRANALYCIRLAAQYFSLIKRAQPLSEALTIPVLGLVMAGASAAGGQFGGLQTIFRYADEVIGLIPGRESQCLNLPAVQEITRRVTTLLRETPSEAHGDDNQDAIQNVMAEAKIVQELVRSHIGSIPSRRSDSWNWPLARLRLGPPSMNKWYAFYGLLDCIRQMAHCLPPGQLSPALLEKFKQLVEDSEFEEFRWKIIEVFLAYAPTRTEPDSWLPSVHYAWQHDTPRVFEELEAVTAILEKDPMLAGEDEFESSSLRNNSTSADNVDHHEHNLTLTETQRSSEQASTEITSIASNRRTMSATSSAIEPHAQSDTSLPSQLTDNQATHRSLLGAQLASTQSHIMDCMEGDLPCWQQDGETHVSQLLPSRGIFRKSFAYAGLSIDCKMVFFYSSAKVCLYSIKPQSQADSRIEMIFERKFSNDNQITDVLVSNTVLAVSTRQCLELHKITSPSIPWNRREVNHGDWDPSGLATHEQDSEVLIAIGHRRQTRRFREGRVTLYRWQHGSTRVETVAVHKLPSHDLPKGLMFDCHGRSLTCITEILNSVLVWNMLDPEPFVISRFNRNPETDSDGVTSAVIFHTPSKRSYVLCSTSASTERFRSKGEWSFSALVTAGAEQSSHSSVHDFTDLTSYRQFVTGAVSGAANLYAVLEKTGKILILQLTGHEEGGIYTRNQAPVTLKVSLCSLRTSRASAACLKFDPSGKKLYAVDPGGKLAVTTFRPEH
ncbi:MAG: hypothetical protein Q9219_003689 [cf. Caloplaca sp. 3 TL-2023]